MNGTKTIDPKVRARRLGIRLALLVVYAVALVLCFYGGKGHAILVDNKDAEGAPALEGIMVSVDGREALELYAGDRDRVNVKSQRHKVRVEDFNGTILAERSFTVDVDHDMVLLSVPKLVAGLEPFIEKFKPLDQALPPEEPSTGEAFTSPEAGAETPSAPPAAP